MSSCTLIPLARPTFDVVAAQKFFDSARTLLTDIGATINGPTSLVMTPEDTASAEANLKSDEKLYILFNASFADASAAVSLLSKVPGEVLRGPAPTPAAPAPTPAAPAATPTPSPTPTAEVTTQTGYTMAKVKENNSSASCWSVISGNVYNLTQWINSHPGGPSVIRGLCGVDGTSSFNGKHRGDGGPASILTGYLLGPLSK